MIRLATSLFLLMAMQLTSATPATAQESKPGPEVLKLGYYLGTWTGHGQSKGGPFGPAGELSSTTSCEWFTGGYQLVCRGEESGPTGKRQFLNIKAYDEEAKAYVEFGVSSQGESEYSTGGTFAGNQRIFVSNIDMDGKPVKIRYVEEQKSPTSFTYQAEASVDGGPWTTIAEGEVRKTE